MPGLKVGLHLVLVEGASILPHAEIPLLVDAAGQFPREQARLGFRYFFLPGIRRQLAREIRAQFEAFAATGLKLDHVNAHKHMHLHPTVARLALEIGREFGCRAMRVPRAFEATGIGGHALAAWTTVLKQQVRAAGMVSPDYVAGLSESGHFDETSFLQAIAHLPEGITEAYFHPATMRDPAFQTTMPGYDHPGELAALLSARARTAIEQAGIALTTYSALAAR